MRKDETHNTPISQPLEELLEWDVSINLNDEKQGGIFIDSDDIRSTIHTDCNTKADGDSLLEFDI